MTCSSPAQTVPDPRTRRQWLVALAAGAPLLSDPAWSLDFARAASAALAKAVVRVDVPSMAISY